MIDRPDAPRLLRAMAETLTEEVLPATSGGARHSARVVANLCRILERELETGKVARETSRTEIGALLDRDLSLAELAQFSSIASSVLVPLPQVAPSPRSKRGS